MCLNLLQVVGACALSHERAYYKVGFFLFIKKELIIILILISACSHCYLSQILVFMNRDIVAAALII